MRQGEIYPRLDSTSRLLVVIVSGEMFNDAGTGMVFVCPVISGHPHAAEDHTALLPVDVAGEPKLIVPDRLHFLPTVALPEAAVAEVDSATLTLLRQVIASIFD